MRRSWRPQRMAPKRVCPPALRGARASAFSTEAAQNGQTELAAFTCRVHWGRTRKTSATPVGLVR